MPFFYSFLLFLVSFFYTVPLIHVLNFTILISIKIVTRIDYSTFCGYIGGIHIHSFIFIQNIPW